MTSVLIVGAGPNGLSAAASLRAAGAEVYIHGRSMETWKERMPEGMILRSSRVSSSIASPGDELSIGQFERQTGRKVDLQPTLQQFLDYAQWFQDQAGLEIDETLVRTIERNGKGFVAVLEDGRSITAENVVLAPGITLFPYIPPEFVSTPPQLASHSSRHSSFRPFEGKDVVVIGKGQSALESAALLFENGANVEVITRGTQLNYIKKGNKRGLLGRITSTPRIQEFLYPPTDLAGPPHNWAIADPMIYRALPKSEQTKLFILVGPIGSANLESRLAGARISTNVTVVAACEKEGKLHLDLSDGSSREVDHAIIATGFLPDLRQIPFLSDELKDAIEQEGGYPILTPGYESTSVNGLYFTGALAGLSQGPITRFVCGTYPLMQYLTEAITGSRIGYPDERAGRLVAQRRLFYRAYQLSPLRG